MQGFLLKIRRGETPFFRKLKGIAKAIMFFSVPVPRVLVPVFRLLYQLHFGIVDGIHWLIAVFYNAPLTRARCASAGKNLRVVSLPVISGHPEIHIGDNVWIDGKIGIASGRSLDRPRLIIGDKVFIAHQVTFSVNAEIVIEYGAALAKGCMINDSDGHPSDPTARAAGMPAPPEEILPVRIGRHAWLGANVVVLKGVTVGEGAIVGAGSVVVTSIPPFSIAMGNPARVVRKTAGAPAAAPPPPPASVTEAQP